MVEWAGVPAHYALTLLQVGCQSQLDEPQSELPLS